MDMILWGHLVRIPLLSLFSANQSAPAGFYRGHSGLLIGWDVMLVNGGTAQNQEPLKEENYWASCGHIFYY